MRTSLHHAVLVVSITACSTMALGARVRQTHEHPPEGGAHHHPQAAALKNPVPASAASVAAGQALYQKQCAGCHGDTERGTARWAKNSTRSHPTWPTPTGSTARPTARSLRSSATA